MLPVLRLLAVAVPVALLALLIGGPVAAADPWTGCGPHSLEEKTVRVFPRAPSATGPAGTSSELQCGNRYYGFRRIEPRWSAGATGDWRAVADAAIGGALVSDTDPVHNPRNDSWTYETPEAVVVAGPRGLIIDARPSGR